MLGINIGAMNYYNKSFSVIKNFNIPYTNSDESKKLNTEFQRIEYLGNYIFEAVVVGYLFNKLKDKPESYLSELRSKIGSRQYQKYLFTKLKLNTLINEEFDKEILKTSIYANTFEALIGAIYLDGGILKVEEFFYNNLIKNNILNIDLLPENLTNFKGLLIEYCTKNKLILKFESELNSDTDLDKKFKIKAFINNELNAEVYAPSIKIGEQKTSAKILNLFKIYE